MVSPHGLPPEAFRLLGKWPGTRARYILARILEGPRGSGLGPAVGSWRRRGKRTWNPSWQRFPSPAPLVLVPSATQPARFPGAHVV